MQLLKARLNGVGSLAQSDWFNLSPGLNLLHIPDDSVRQAFLRQLATINPSPPFSYSEPFGNVPATLNERGYPRPLNPSKRTAALAVFAAHPSLIVELGKVEAILDGVDRIEVGRRLDGSRWLNFVEIASACRWWEIDADITRLLETLRQHHPTLRQLGIRITSGLEPSRRIKDNLEKELAAWLSGVLEESTPVEVKPLAERVFHQVTRPSRVAVAKRLVEERLPIFIDLAALPSITKATGTNSSGTRIGLGEGLVASGEKGGERIILIDGDEAVLAMEPSEDFRNLLVKLAAHCQIIYAFGNTDLLQESYPSLARRTVPGLRMAPA